jgi:hypothetical protein
MPMPNLLHPVDVSIQTQSTNSTQYDEDLREPIQQTVKTVAQTVDGQVKWANSEEIKVTIGGVQKKADGYVLFRYIDLESAATPITLKVNDRIISIDGENTDVYVMKLIPCGHYPGLGKTMVKAFFEDRQPSKQRLDM